MLELSIDSILIPNMTGSDSTEKNRANRVLVSGATGFIGKNLVESLLQKGYSVRVLVRDKKGVDFFSDIEIFEGDLTGTSSLAGVEKDIDIVVNCVGILGRWNTDEANLYKVNVQGCINLLKRFNGKYLHRFIHLSAAGVTGPLRDKACETYNCQPVTAYEKTKLLGEKKILKLSRQMNIPVTVLRPAFTYGPGDSHKLVLFKAIKKGKFIFINNGESTIHPVYIKDLISGILLAIKQALNGEIYIIGGERPVTQKELIYTIADNLGVKRPELSIPYWLAWLIASILEIPGKAFGFEPVITHSRVMMMGRNYGYSIDKAKKDLDYKPRINLQEGITRTINYYKKNKLL